MDWRNDPRYLEAKAEATQWAHEHAAADPATIEWADSLTQQALDRVTSDFAVLDDKADQLLRWFGGLGGLAGVAVSLFGGQVSPLIVATFLPPVAAAIAAAILALVARNPDDVALPPTLDCASNRVDVIGTRHMTTIQIQIACARKGKWIRAAQYCAAASVGLVLLPLIVIAVQ